MLKASAQPIRWLAFERKGYGPYTYSLSKQWTGRHNLPVTRFFSRWFLPRLCDYNNDGRLS